MATKEQVSSIANMHTAVIVIAMLVAFWMWMGVPARLMSDKFTNDMTGFSSGVPGGSAGYGGSARLPTEIDTWQAGTAGLAYGNTSSGFLGSPEPPVFYDIGDVQDVRNMRDKRGYIYNTSTGHIDVGGNMDETNDQDNRMYYIGKDANGNRVTMKCAQGMVANKLMNGCVAIPSEGWRAVQEGWRPVQEGFEPENIIFKQ
jgi:hypothetical protein